MDLNDLCKEQNKDVVKILIRFRVLLESYLLFKKGDDYKEEIENTAEEGALHLFLNLKAHEHFLNPYRFWFVYIQKVALSTYNKLYRLQDRVTLLDTLIIIRDSDPYRDPVTTNERDGHVFLSKWYAQLLRSNTLEVSIDFAKQYDPLLGSYLEKRIKKDLKKLSTRDLLAIYKGYVKKSVMEVKRCKKKLKGVFLREPPSLRLNQESRK